LAGDDSSYYLFQIYNSYLSKHKDFNNIERFKYFLCILLLHKEEVVRNIQI